MKESPTELQKVTTISTFFGQIFYLLWLFKFYKHSFEVKVSWLGINFLVLADIIALVRFHSQISGPYLISELLVAGSSWPRTLFTSQVFLFSISLLFVNILFYS